MIKFNEKYNHDDFLDFVVDFLPEDFTEKEEDIIIDSTRAKKITKAKILGASESLELVVLEMDHNSENDPRIAIATDAFKILANHWIHKALVVFKNKESNNYRLSYLTISLDLNDKNKAVKTYSNARRYSFYLGEHAKVRTPEQQLIKKGRVKDVDDLLNRFSVEVVNKQFYLEVAKFFDELIDGDEDNLILPSLSKEDINIRKSFAVRLIGRIMFCWFLKQKKSSSGQLIPDELLSSFVVENSYYHNILEPLFFGVLNTALEFRDIRSDLFDLVPYLNGGLFNPQSDDYYELDRGTFTSRHTNTLKISDTWFKNFFELLETYNFTIDENTVFDQELSVDPEMLGRIFENLLAEINPETGSSERKRTGSFYTPRQIVEYMVDQSLIEYLKTKTNVNEKKIIALVSYDLADDLEYILDDTDRQEIVQAIESLKILDPACGSGAFPIGSLQKIVYILQQTDPDCMLWLAQRLKGIPELYRQKIVNEIKSTPFDYTRKLDVIKNSIFGVDIQPIAVDVSRLRCFLTLVVESEVDDTKPNRGVEPLPNLDFKFVCANTLVGLPKVKQKQPDMFDDHSGIAELSKIMSEYFSCNSQRKNEIKLKFINVQKGILEQTISKFGKNTGELTLKLTTWNPFSNISSLWFDLEWMFGLDDKFDIVIANPPYVDSETMVKNQPELRDIYSKSYETAKGNWDLYIPFLEFGFKALKSGGVASFITPNKWYAIGYGKEIRKKLLNNIIKIANCNNVNVFEAGNSPVVTLFGEKTNNNQIKVEEFDSIYNIIKTTLLSTEVVSGNFGVVFADQLQLVSRIKADNKKVSDYFKSENPCTVSEAYVLAGMIEELPANSDGEDFFFFVNTGTIDPYVSLWGKKTTTYLKSKYEKPVINREKFREQFPKRYNQFSRQKLVISGMRHFESFLDDNGIYIAGKSTEILVTTNQLDMKIALLILNSSIIKFYIKQNYSVLGIDGGINFTPELIENLPFPSLERFEHLDSLITLVDEILAEQNCDEFKLIKYKIDEVVHDLYGLSEDEKEIIRKS